jgi:defect-in-organelle-trafficking protein DotC
MKPKLLAAVLGIAVGCAYGADGGRTASASPRPGMEPDDSAVTLEALLDVPSKAGTGVNSLRAQMVGDAGRTVGFRSGMLNRSRALAKGLDSRVAELDALFQFSTLIRTDGTLPPVIVEAIDVASFGPDQFRVAGHVYRIEKAERFVSVPPTWRNYLLAGLSMNEKVELPVLEARPQDAKEMLVWRDAVRHGWDQGEKQADAVLDANFNRLTRDYTGMILYSPLLAQGMIMPNTVAVSTQAVTGDGQKIVVNDTLRRLTSKARFETNIDKWRRATPTGVRAANGIKPVGAGGDK